MTIAISFFDRILHPLYSSYQVQTYYGLALYIFLATALCGLLATLAYLFSLSSVQDSEKRSEYECGFEPFDSATRLPFDVHFYLVGILFLIFDVEIALLFPWVLALRTCGWFGLYLMLGFIILLAVGFLYEWKRGALIWPSRQQEQPYISGPTSNFFALVISGDAVSELVQVERAALYHQLLDGLLPEFLFTGFLTAILTYLAVQLGKDVDKFVLAENCLRYVRYSMLALFAFYAYFVLNGAYTALLFNGYIFTSFSGLVIKMLTVFATLVISYNLTTYFRESTRPLLEFPLVLALSLLFLLFLLSAAHLFTAFLAIVGFSLNTYVLIFFEANRSAIARESGIKYFYLSAFSSGLMIYGIFLIFLIFGTGQISEIQKILASQPELLANSLNLLHVGLAFLLVGLFFKLSAFPGHLWAPEVYDGAPDSVIAFFIVPVKVAVLTFVISLLGTAFDLVSFIWQPILALAAAGSLVWGCFAALFELKTKRFLAYASINQMGFLLMGVASGTIEGYRATLIYLFLYVAINVIFLIVFLNARRSDGRSLIYLTDFRRLAASNWNASFSVAMALLSIAGIPPLAGFFGKYYLLIHAQEQGLYGLVAIALITSLISTYYYLRLIKIFWFENGVGLRAISCILSSKQHYTIFIFEGLLWSFILFSTELVGFFDLITLNMLGSCLTSPDDLVFSLLSVSPPNPILK